MVDKEMIISKWRYAYYSILLLSLCIIPIMTFLSYLSLDEIINTSWNGEYLADIMDFPLLSSWFVNIGSVNIVFIGSIAEVIIILFYFLHHKAIATIAAGIVFSVCTLLMSIAQFASMVALIKAYSLTLG